MAHVDTTQHTLYYIYCQDKNGGIVPQRRRMLKISLFGKDSHINVTEIVIICFWLFLKDLVNGIPLMSTFDEHSVPPSSLYK